MESMQTWREDLKRDGFAIVSGVFSADQVDTIVTALHRALSTYTGQESALRNAEGITYAARNLMVVWPSVTTIWRRQPLPEVLQEVLGTGCGLVRVLFFDKPPERSWCLPWHQDMTIAVEDNQRPSSHFQKPTRKAGVPHVEAPPRVLESMLTVRIHLDDVTEENGPLRVLPGSHVMGQALRIDETQARSILVRRGDVLLMRPLLAHSSRNSQSGTLRHRRILHLEFAASKELPDGYAWHDFTPV